VRRAPPERRKGRGRIEGALDRLPARSPGAAPFRRDLEDPDFGPDLRSREGQVQAMALQIQPGRAGQVLLATSAGYVRNSFAIC